jgi:RNA polymerase sigma factor (sigma-70 family)
VQKLIPLLEQRQEESWLIASLTSVASDLEAVKNFTLSNPQRRLVEQNLDLAAKLASRLRRRLPARVDRDELLSDAHWGLMEAASTFDPNRCNCFRGYATRRIEGAMLDGLRTRNQIRRHQPPPRLQSLSSMVDRGDGMRAPLEQVLVAPDRPIDQRPQMLEELARAMAALSRGDRARLRDLYLRGLEQRDIAHRLRISESAVSQQMRKLRRRLITVRQTLQNN